MAIKNNQANVIWAGQLFNRMRMWLAGMQMHGRRDLYDVFGWQRVTDYQVFLAKFYKQGMAKRVIELPVDSMWSDPPQLMADNQEFSDAWNQIVQINTLWHHIIRLDTLAGLGRFAVMVVGFDDGRKLDSPISSPANGGTPRNIMYLQPYHEGAIRILEWETDTSDPRFGQPVMYSINPGRAVVDGLMASFTEGMNAVELRQPFNCHYTRLVHVAENLLEDSIFGTSRLEAINNDLDDLLKVQGGASELFWQVSNRGMQFDLDKDMDLDPDALDELRKEVDEYGDQLRRIVRTRGVKITNLGSETANPENTHLMLIRSISIATGIPQLVLMGATAGHLSSQQDRANWSQRIAERVTKYGAPVVLKRVLDCFINAGALPIPENLSIQWPEAFKMSPLERAQTSAQMARSAANMAKAHNTMQPTDTVTDPETGQVTQVQRQPTAPLFTPDEMRRIVSFGKHPPVFDSPQPTGLTLSPGDPAGLAPAGKTSPPGGNGAPPSG